MFCLLTSAATASPRKHSCQQIQRTRMYLSKEQAFRRSFRIGVLSSLLTVGNDNDRQDRVLRQRKWGITSMLHNLLKLRHPARISSTGITLPPQSPLPADEEEKNSTSMRPPPNSLPLAHCFRTSHSARPNRKLNLNRTSPRSTTPNRLR